MLVREGNLSTNFLNYRSNLQKGIHLIGDGQRRKKEKWARGSLEEVLFAKTSEVLFLIIGTFQRWFTKPCAATSQPEEAYQQEHVGSKMAGIHFLWWVLLGPNVQTLQPAHLGKTP